LFGKPVFKKPLENNFGWMGLVGIAAGIVVAILGLVLGVNSQDTARIWFYLLVSAMMTLVGVQLVISWVLMRILEELEQRESLVQKDLL